MKIVGSKKIEQIRGRAQAGQASQSDVHDLLCHIDVLQNLLDEGDQDDMYGTEGWRHSLGDSK